MKEEYKINDIMTNPIAKRSKTPCSYNLSNYITQYKPRMEQNSYYGNSNADSSTFIIGNKISRHKQESQRK